jgi:hypothetical protein
MQNNPALRIYEDDELLSKTVKTFVHELQLDPNNPTHIRNFTSALELFSYGQNDWDLDLLTNKDYNIAWKKRVEERKFKEFVKFDPRNLKDKFDIVAVTGNSSMDMNYLNDWKPMIEGMHVIIIQQGDPDRLVKLPEWLDYELYTKKDVERDVGTDKAWIFNMDGDDNGAMNFGLIVSDRDLVYLLDRRVKPVFREGGDAMEMLRIHALNLLRPSIPSYYNNRMDPYNDHQDFIRGYPYSLRDGVETAISFGTFHHERDSATDLLKQIYGNSPSGSSSSTSTSTSTSSSGNASERSRRGLRNHDGSDEQGRGKQDDEQAYLTKRALRHVTLAEDKMAVAASKNAFTIPKGVYFSLSTLNIAVARNKIGPVFCLLSPVMQKEKGFQIGEEYYDILLGWILKTAFDYVGLGIKHFDSTDYLTYRMPPIIQSEEDLIKSLKKDLIWFNRTEVLIRSFQNVKHSEKAVNDLNRAVHETIEQVAPTMKDYGEASLLRLIDQFMDWKTQREGFHTRLNPVSSRSTHRPHADSPHQCATYTIIRDEVEMLDVWLRYAARHFSQGDVYIFFHHSSDSLKTGDATAISERESKVRNVLGRYQAKDGLRLTVFDVFDDAAGFPMYLFVGIADMFQRRLLRYGYKCVLLSDVDEIILIDPDVYPGGLKEYLTYFVHNSTATNYRAQGYMLSQIASITAAEEYGKRPHKRNVSIEAVVEGPLNWSKSILSQRHFWVDQQQYYKPVLSKIPTRHKAGFHRYYFPIKVATESSMYLLHLREVDEQFCLIREKHKYELIQHGHQSETTSLNGHISSYERKLKNGELCQFARGKYDVIDDRFYDGTSRIGLSEMDPKWTKVEL